MKRNYLPKSKGEWNMRKLRDLEVSAIGYGCMGLSHGYGPVPDRAEAIRLIRYAYELGCTHFDTAEGYGTGDNEKLLGEAIEPIRNKVVIATKFNLATSEAGSQEKVTRSVKVHLEASLKRLGTDYVELYYQHRINKSVPVEEVAYAMGVLIKEGKILGWGQSQSTEDEIRRAHAVTPLTAIQSEYSIMERMFEKDVIPACDELNIGFVPFSPLGAGFLSGKYNAETQYTGDDVRRVITRFDKKNIHANQPLLDLLHSFGALKNATLAQIALAWMLHKKEFISPIPGSRKPERIEENMRAADVELTADEFNQIETELAKIKIHGNRTDEDIMKLRDLI
jgi:aryl-alcohol dehydrogenase-like predicted oxidoreductase